MLDICIMLYQGGDEHPDHPEIPDIQSTIANPISTFSKATNK